MTNIEKKVFNLDKGKIEYALGNKEFCFGREYFDFISDVGTRGIYLPNSNI